MTEQMPYTVTAKRDGYELRHYDRAILVRVTVTGDAERAGNAGFGPLVRYISGDNMSSERMAMTSPVLQESASTSTHVVSFVLPADVDPASIPVPRNSVVKTEVVDARNMDARTYIGRWTDAKFRENAEQLSSDLARDGLTVSGKPMWARYDPPWTLPFMRRNEVLIPIGDVA
jgi:hypothetical protein